jgi:hypothetical protein
VSFPFDLHSAAVFHSHMPCSSPAMSRICPSESDLSRSRQGRGRGTALELHCMCELASAVQRQHVGDNAGSGRDAAGERHGMCKSALRRSGNLPPSINLEVSLYCAEPDVDSH